MLKKTEIYEKQWVVFEHGKKVFLFVSFSGLNVIVVCFCVSGKVVKVLEMLIVPILGLLLGGLFLFSWVSKV